MLACSFNLFSLIIKLKHFNNISLLIKYNKFCFLQIKVLCYKKFNHFLCKNYHLHWIAGRANILSKYIIYIFLKSEYDFCGSFPMLYPKAAASCCKNFFELIFAAL